MDKAKKPRIELIKSKLGLRFLISVICFVAIAASGSLISYKSLRALYDGSLRDAWTILFLDLETQAGRMGERIEKEVEKVSKRDPIAKFTWIDKNKIMLLEGPWKTFKTLDDLGLDPSQFKVNSGIKSVFTSVNGSIFYVQLVFEGTNRYLNFYPFKLEGLSDVFNLKEKQTITYVLNRTGKLLFSNTNQVNPKNVTTRPLVAAFVAAPFSQGQTEFDAGKDSLYGFHQEIRPTNLVLFAEKTKRRAMENVYKTLFSTSKVVAIILIISIISLQIPISMMTSPIRTLAETASQIARGNFDIKMPRKGIGELSVLTAGFETMIINLRERDRSIQSLNDQKLEKLKLENELKLASTIQDRFLFKPNLPDNAHLKVAAVYQPATQVAGDWYGVHYDKDRDEIVLAIVDITGHGVGSAMMTPIISVLFYEDISSGEAFSPQRFIQRCNSALYAFGTGKATATAIVMKICNKSNRITWINAGHPSPLFLNSEGKTISHTAKAGSNILGMEKTIATEPAEIELKKGDRLLIYSDGLTSPAVTKGIAFNRKDIVKTLKPLGTQNPNKQLETLLKTLGDHVGNDMEDDLCVIMASVV